MTGLLICAAAGIYVGLFGPPATWEVWMYWRDGHRAAALMLAALCLALCLALIAAALYLAWRAGGAG